MIDKNIPVFIFVNAVWLKYKIVQVFGDEAYVLRVCFVHCSLFPFNNFLFLFFVHLFVGRFKNIQRNTTNTIQNERNKQSNCRKKIFPVNYVYKCLYQITHSEVRFGTRNTFWNFYRFCVQMNFLFLLLQWAFRFAWSKCDFNWKKFSNYFVCEVKQQKMWKRKNGKSQ